MPNFHTKQFSLSLKQSYYWNVVGLGEREDGYSESYSVEEQFIIKYRNIPRETSQGLAQRGIPWFVVCVALFFSILVEANLFLIGGTSFPIQAHGTPTTNFTKPSKDI